MFVAERKPTRQPELASDRHDSHAPYGRDMLVPFGIWLVFQFVALSTRAL